MARKSQFSASKRRREIAKREKKQKKEARKEERKRLAALEEAGLLPPEAEDQADPEGLEAPGARSPEDPEEGPRLLQEN